MHNKCTPSPNLSLVKLFTVFAYLITAILTDVNILVLVHVFRCDASSTLLSSIPLDLSAQYLAIRTPILNVVMKHAFGLLNFLYAKGG